MGILHSKVKHEEPSKWMECYLPQSASNVYISEQNNAVKLLSSREVEGNGPMKPGNPLCNVAQQGANSGEALYAFRKMRGIRDDASPLLKWGFFVTVSACSILQVPYKPIVNYYEEEE